MTLSIPKNTACTIESLLLGFSWLGGTAPAAQANVSLLYFRVDPGTTPTELKVLWETETETDTVGFRVRRSTTSNVQQATIIAQVANTGSPVSGASYNYTDSGLTPDQPYYYWLYELTSTGEDVLISIPNPGSVIPNAPANTPTTTATLTAPTRLQQASRRRPPQPPRITPTTRPPDPTATFTVLPQATNTPVSVQQTQPNQPTSSTPVVSVPTPTIEGVAPNPELPTPDSKSGATVNPVAEGLTSTTDQVPQAPPAPTQVLDAGVAGGAASDVGRQAWTRRTRLRRRSLKRRLPALLRRQSASPGRQLPLGQQRQPNRAAAAEVCC